MINCGLLSLIVLIADRPTEVKIGIYVISFYSISAQTMVLLFVILSIIIVINICALSDLAKLCDISLWIKERKLLRKKEKSEF